MSAYVYDEVLATKFKNWTKNSKVEIYGPNEVERLFETIADKHDDKPITLPIITISRERGYSIINSGTTRRPLSYSGIRTNATKETSEVVTAIPIALTYQIDVFAKKVEEADIIARNLIFNIVNYPAMTVEIPGAHIYNASTGKYDPFEHTARIEFASNEIQDNSNLKERFIEGNFTRMSMQIAIQDAYLWDTREHRNAEIEIRIDDLYEPHLESDLEEEDSLLIKNMENKN